MAVTEIYIFARDAEDFSGTGLCGALSPNEALCEYRENELPTLRLTHPYDSAGKWREIAAGRVLSAPCRVRTTPEMSGTAYVTTVEVYTVAATATWSDRGVFTKKTGGARKKTLKSGTRVVVTGLSGTRYRIKAGSVTGWMETAGLSVEYETVTIPANATGMEQAAPPLPTKRQLFRITSVLSDTETGEIVCEALHIAGDCARSVTRFKSELSLTGIDALGAVNHETGAVTGGIFGNLDLPTQETGVRAYTDIADARIGADWRDRNALDALLNEEDGFAARWGAELVTDDYELYLLHRAGADRGVSIEHGKNIAGAYLARDISGVVTAIKPMGKQENGDPLYLTDSESDAANYVLSTEGIANYGYIAKTLECEDCSVGSGTRKVTKAVARQRMLAQAQACFTDQQLDQEAFTLVVQLALLSDSREYAQYKGLEGVFLYDTVHVKLLGQASSVSATVRGMVWDCLAARVLEVTLGQKERENIVFSRDIVSLNGKKLTTGSVGIGAMAEEVGSSLVLKGDAAMQVGTTSINSALGVKVAQDSGTYFQANNTKFGLYKTSDSSAIAEGGIDTDGTGYFASNRLRDPTNPTNGHTDLAAIAVSEGGGYEMRFKAPDAFGSGYVTGMTLGVRNLPTTTENSFSGWLYCPTGLIDTGRMRGNEFFLNNDSDNTPFSGKEDNLLSGCAFSITIAASAWSGNTYTAALEGLTFNDMAHLIVTPAPSSIASGVYALSYGNSASTGEAYIIFACSSAPSSAVTMQVLVIGGAEVNT